MNTPNRRAWADPEPQPRGRMIVGTATLTRGQKVHVIERDGPVLTVETSDGRSHIVTIGDVLFSPKNQARLEAAAEPGYEPAIDGVLSIFEHADARDDILAHLTLGEAEAIAYLAYYRGREFWPLAQQIMLAWARNDEDADGEDDFYLDTLARWGLAFGAVDSDIDTWHIASLHLNPERSAS